jgi:hypothetical protein
VILVVRDTCPTPWVTPTFSASWYSKAILSGTCCTGNSALLIVVIVLIVFVVIHLKQEQIDPVVSLM